MNIKGAKRLIDFGINIGNTAQFGPQAQIIANGQDRFDRVLMTKVMQAGTMGDFIIGGWCRGAGP